MFNPVPLHDGHSRTSIFAISKWLHCLHVLVSTSAVGVVHSGCCLPAARIRTDRRCGHGRGGCWSKASRGRSVLNSWRNAVKRRYCAPSVTAVGRVASRLSVLCMRSCRPFCSGCAGSISSGRMPSRTHQTENVESRPSALEANGWPLSVRIRSGRP